MSTHAMRKLSATFLVLVMALSALGYLPISNVGQAAGTKNIYVPVFSNGSPVTDATVTLTDVHTGDVVNAAYSSARSSYVVSGAPSGYFKIVVTAADYYDSLGQVTFKYNSFSNYTVNPIELVEFPYKNYQWNITVRDASTTHIISGAMVGFYDPTAEEYVSSVNTDVFGRAIVSVFGTAMMGDLQLVIKKSQYGTYVEPVIITANNVTTISLSSSMRVTGFVADWNGPASNVVSYLVSTDPGTPSAKRVMKSTGSGMAFDAYPGDFVLVVDADGDSSYVDNLVVGASVNLGTITLANQTKRVEQVDIAFGADYNSLDLAVHTTWSYDDTHPALMYNDIGSLRVQIDLAGNCDGFIDATERAAFFDMLNTYGPQYVTSQNLLVINDTVYEATPMTDYVMDLAEGPVTDMMGVNYSYAAVYTLHGSLTAGLSQYGAIVTARYDKASVDYDYKIALVNGYELVGNMSSTHVEITGYLTVDVDPLVYTGGTTEKVSLTLQTNRIPVPKGAMVSSPFVAPIPNETGVITYYIVKVGANATFNSSASSDPNGNPLTFIWDFGDSSPVATTANDSVVHVYSAAAASITVTLTVKDVANLTNSTTIKVVCDDRNPTPVIRVKTIPVVGNAIAVDQNQVITFNGTDCKDGAVTSSDGLGVISYFKFNFGDGNDSEPIPWVNKQKNYTHYWERSGTYTLYLNVTDVVGHNASTTMTVVVNDTTKPTVGFTYKNADDNWSSTLVEGKNITFDAEATWDNVDNSTTLKYRWYFSADNTTEEGVGVDFVNVTHVFSKVGSSTVTLNVTDSANNTNQKIVTIKIAQKPRPEMMVTGISYDPDTFTDGKSGTIWVNMTNTGSANATGVVMDFYMVVNGQKTLIGSSTLMEKNGTAITSVGIGEKVQGKFVWTPSDRGTYTIEVRVNSTLQLEEFEFTDAQGLVVKQAAWVQYALWGGVAAIIILVPTLLLLRGRLAKREKKGPRREKKEPEEE